MHEPEGGDPVYRANMGNSFGGGYRSYDNKPKSAPVDVGKQYDVKIEDIAKQGDGIARISGFVIFVPHTKIGDEVKIEIKAVKRNFAFAEVVEE
ncbi:MAG TPA: TRAM domain-containing protein [Candidatus Acidoferrales bacterium]|nr:TRAM domain-containing protein [Candidatus Acidoferrales bacterium]